MSLSGIEPSSRRCGFQPVSRPSRIWNTEPDWISIRIGASSAESTISISAETMSRIAPPQARRAVAAEQHQRRRPNSFGASRIAHGEREQRQARARGRTAARPGRGGKSRVKYSGRM